MLRVRLAAMAAVCVLGAGCGDPADIMETDSASQPLAGSTAFGSIPSGLPARLSVGLFEDSGGTWMKSSGAAWDMRYRYLTKGWVNNWGWGSTDGNFALSFWKECATQGYVPVVQYYQLYGESGGGESASLTKVQNKTTMKSYFGDFKILMQRAKDFGKPVVVLLEADAFAFLEQQAKDNSSTYAAVADTGLTELKGLPNTVAGWGLAFLALRKSVGASNVSLGIHISAWASGKDIAYSSATVALQPEVDKVYSFLAPFGLAANVTGQTYDLLVGDPLDRDADYYRLKQGGQDRWWDTSDSASTTSKSFNRYAEWLRLWNVKTERRWVLWQIPLGNSAHKNVNNNGGSGEGYKDNRAEYFFAGDKKHLERFAESGTIALLFGAGASGMSGYQNDTFSDGKLFMQSRAGGFLNAGGLAIDSGGAEGGDDGGGSVPSGYDFETGLDGWTKSGDALATLSRSTTRAFSGTGSLALTFGGKAGTELVYVPAPTPTAGTKVTFRIWLPSGSSVTSLQPYLLQGAAGGWAWTGNWKAASSLKTNAWNEISVTLPTNAVTPLDQLGIEVVSSGSWTGTAYVDAVTF